MFQTVKKEAAAVVWFLRCKFGSTAALAAIPFATFAVHRARAKGERDRTARFAGMAAAALLAASKFITPRVLNDAAEQVVDIMQTRRG